MLIQGVQQIILIRKKEKAFENTFTDNQFHAMCNYQIKKTQ